MLILNWLQVYSHVQDLVNLLLSISPLVMEKNWSINTTTKEAEGAEAKAKAAQAYTEEASKTLRGRNICKMRSKKNVFQVKKKNVLQG
ncbi:hypothetical protein HID58_042058 [Brassica napus]|uniref:Uncharacterized protein n=1 Tax=Brassica napus TaxID=3708 RepID=A0ABQ8BCL8_BRANA|nr:hypothetical protein HID58_042058 [Brassica napus]